MEPLIELKHIYKIYQMGGEEVRANDDISLTIFRGEFVAIVGKSGSGKSTLMNIIGALDVPTDGDYMLGGEDVSEMTDDQLAAIRNRMIGFVFQQYNLLPKLNLLENVELPLLYAGVPAGERKERALASLERVGLADKWRNLLRWYALFTGTAVAALLLSGLMLLAMLATITAALALTVLGIVKLVYLYRTADVFRGIAQR